MTVIAIPPLLPRGEGGNRGSLRRSSVAPEGATDEWRPKSPPKGTRRRLRSIRATAGPGNPSILGRMDRDFFLASVVRIIGTHFLGLADG